MHSKNIKNTDGTFRKTELNDNQILTKLDKNRDNWIAMASSFLGNNNSIAEDIVQDSYLKLSRLGKLHKTINVFDNGDTKINIGYMYMTIRSLSYDYLKADEFNTGVLVRIPNDSLIENDSESSFSTIAINEQILKNYQDDDYSVEGNEAMGLMVDCMNDVIDNCDWFDKQVYKLYVGSGKSMQDLSDETSISKTSINQAVQRVKSAIREAVREDYIDYKNGSYAE